MRGFRTKTGRQVQLEGDNLRYAAIVALGLSRVDIGAQRQILAGGTAADLAIIVATRAELCADTGAMALAAWAAAEAANMHAARLLYRLECQLASGARLTTVDCAWMVLAALAARYLADTSELAKSAARHLFEVQGPHGLFSETIPASDAGHGTTPVGSFDDQVYSIQALARLHAAHGDEAALAAAQKCADRICRLQGRDGQWWWHYDVRSGQVIEGRPVYSVYQHAMAPMALLDLQEAGGVPRWGAIVKGLEWLERHPGVDEPLVSDQQAVIWRKVYRREPTGLVRAFSTAAVPLMSCLHLPRLAVDLAPYQVDYECRPYELGWLLYAWLSGGEAAWPRGVENILTNVE
ncbi:hypothetical protein [Mesorhizobium sp. CN2-181]|uniref:hypothetical protein n=1 Tax=Mesorhizobium yinganensis TaxID=3157707 RepID=UPI0032B795C3